MVATSLMDFYGETLEEMLTCGHVHYLSDFIGTTHLKTNHPWEKIPLVTVKLPKVRPNDRPNTFGRAKNPLVRNDPKLQRGF